MHKYGIAVLFIVTVFGSACGKDKEANKDQGKATSSEADQVITELTALKDRTCACADKDCALKVGEEAAAFESTVKTRFPNPTAEQMATFKTIAGELKACLRRPD